MSAAPVKLSFGDVLSESFRYFFGNLPLVKQHLEKIIWALIIVPGLIAVFGAWRASKAEKARAAAG